MPMDTLQHWLLPPAVKVYEALGAVADGRVQVIDACHAKVKSSSGNKTYTIFFDPETKELSVNDNGSYYQGYVGYPALAFLMIKRIVPYDENLAEALKGIPWKQINQDNKNDFEQTIAYLSTLVDKERLEAFAARVLSQLETLELRKPKTIPQPPSGW